MFANKLWLIFRARWMFHREASLWFVCMVFLLLRIYSSSISHFCAMVYRDILTRVMTRLIFSKERIRIDSKHSLETIVKLWNAVTFENNNSETWNQEDNNIIKISYQLQWSWDFFKGHFHNKSELLQKSLFSNIGGATVKVLSVICFPSLKLIWVKTAWFSLLVQKLIID